MATFIVREKMNCKVRNIARKIVTNESIIAVDSPVTLPTSTHNPSTSVWTLSASAFSQVVRTTSKTGKSSTNKE
jgi:hypothetical protein